MGEYEAKRERGKGISKQETAGRGTDAAYDRQGTAGSKIDAVFSLETPKIPLELVYSRDRQEQTALKERGEGGQNMPVVQRVADIAEIALSEAYRKVLQLYGPITRTKLLTAMGMWTDLGFSRNIFPELAAFAAGGPGDAACVAYFEACIRRYYTPGYPAQLNCPPIVGLTGAGLGTDQGSYGVGGAGAAGLLGRDLAHRNNPDNLNPQLDAVQPGRPGSVVQVLSYVLSSGFFTSILASWRNDDMHSLGTTFSSRPEWRLLRARALARGEKTANKMADRPDLNLPPLTYQRDEHMGAIGSYTSTPGAAGGEVIRYNSHFTRRDAAGNKIKQRTTRRTFVHEQFHHLEHYLGVEELANMYRFLYARTSNRVSYDGSGGPALSRGVRRHGANMFMLNMYRPALQPQLPPAPDIGDRQTAEKYAGGYQGVDGIYTRSAAGTPQVHPEHHSTEFLSTTAEMLSSSGLAARLIQTDPMRVALFLKLANPLVYRLVAAHFDARYNPALPVPPVGAPVPAAPAPAVPAPAAPVPAAPAPAAPVPAAPAPAAPVPAVPAPPAPPQVTLDQLLHFT